MWNVRSQNVQKLICKHAFPESLTFGHSDSWESEGVQHCCRRDAVRTSPLIEVEATFTEPIKAHRRVGADRGWSA